MKLDQVFAAVLGPSAQSGSGDWSIADPESARLAVMLAAEARAPLCPGPPRPGRTGLRAPRGIFTLWTDELVARVGAGTPLAELDRALEPHGLALGLECANPDVLTLGSIFATGRAGFAGPRGYPLRDRCVGLSFVDGRARLLAAGGRVVKNVAGYDFGRLHHGAGGSLGLILDLTVRLIARPPARVAVWWPCDRDDLPHRLPEIRAAWGQDAIAELLVDRVAAVRYGLPGAGIVFRHFGPQDLIAERIASSVAVDVSERWPELLRRSSSAGLPISASRLSVVDCGEDWVADLANGVLHCAAPAGEPVAPSRAAIAVKRVLDPHGIWPPLPGGAQDQ